MTIKNILVLFLLLATLAACKNETTTDQASDTAQTSEATPATKAPVRDESIGSATDAAPGSFSTNFKTKDYKVAMHVDSGDTTILTVQTAGLPTETNRRYTIVGQVLRCYMTDLNRDGYFEYLAAYRDTKDSGNIKLLGWAAKNDMKLQDMKIEDAVEPREANSDNVSVANNTVTREFTSNGSPVKYTYEVTEENGEFVLRAVQAQ